MKVKLKTWQADFVRSKAQLPAFVAGWGTGKTLCLIIRAMMYSELIPGNLGVIFRREFNDLKDSTVADFERYTGLKVNSYRNCDLPNGSQLMFRHIEELDNLQNINLGWFGIEQAEELESDEQFFLLWGRLRRDVKPTAEFKRIGLPERSGFCIANAGSVWMRKIWKNPETQRDIIKSLHEDLKGVLSPDEFEKALKTPFFDLTEAKSSDNRDVIPQDAWVRWTILKRLKPLMYERYVENSWDVDDNARVLIPRQAIEALKDKHPLESGLKKLISVDPAYGGDECVVNAWHNSKVIDSLYLYYKDPKKTIGEVLLFARKHDIWTMAIDVINARTMASRFGELGFNVISLDSASKSSDPQYYNLRMEMWAYAAEQILDMKVQYPDDEETRSQLSSVRYEIVDSSGKTKLESTQKIKDRIGRSPDRAMDWVYGIWGLKWVEPDHSSVLQYDDEPVDFMTV